MLPPGSGICCSFIPSDGFTIHLFKQVVSKFLNMCLNRFELMHRKLPPAEIFFLSSLAFPAVFI